MAIDKPIKDGKAAAKKKEKVNKKLDYKGVKSKKGFMRATLSEDRQTIKLVSAQGSVRVEIGKLAMLELLTFERPSVMCEWFTCLKTAPEVEK